MLPTSDPRARPAWYRKMLQLQKQPKGEDDPRSVRDDEAAVGAMGDWRGGADGGDERGDDGDGAAHRIRQGVGQRRHAAQADKGELQLRVEAQPVERREHRARREHRGGACELSARGDRAEERAAAEDEALPDGEFPKPVAPHYGANTPTSKGKRRTSLNAKGVWANIKRVVPGYQTKFRLF